jgi:hypothetical protein
MKTIVKFSGFLLLLLAVSYGSMAQNTKKERQAKKIAEIKAMVDAGNYVFKAEFANPMRGGNINLTSEYDLVVGPDTLIAYLPSYGRAYVAPIDAMDGGIHFTSTKFTYTKQPNKKGGWDVYVKPADAKDVEKMYLNISDDGYASLQITSVNRDPISFQGYIEGKPEKKKKG